MRQNIFLNSVKEKQMDNHLLRIDEVSVILGISRSFAYQLASRGQLRAVKLGRSVRVRPADLERFMAENLNCAPGVEVAANEELNLELEGITSDLHQSQGETNG